MKSTIFTPYLHRAGLRSLHELSRMTGITVSTLSRLAQHPQTARGYQLTAIAEACGMTDEEAMEFIKRH